MKLESVRSLKQEGRESVLQPVMAMTASALALGPAAAPMSVPMLTQPRRLFALGVARGKKPGDYRLAIRLQRRSVALRPHVDRLVHLARGEADVQYVGSVRKLAAPWHQLPQRPLLIGSSIAHRKVTAGTLGCFVRKIGGDADELFALSNNHVLANENRAKVGDAVLQPGPLDEGTAEHRIGSLAGLVKLARHKTNVVDAAIARIDLETVDADLRRLRGAGKKLGGISDEPVQDQTAVLKLGRTTGLTRGYISAFEIDDVVVDFDIGNLHFDQQIEIQGEGDVPFSDGGDSGSLIVDAASRRAVGLLFAGTDTHTYANPIGDVFDALGLELA